jgi:hypothetical protein
MGKNSFANDQGLTDIGMTQFYAQKREEKKTAGEKEEESEPREKRPRRRSVGS